MSFPGMEAVEIKYALIVINYKEQEISSLR